MTKMNIKKGDKVKVLTGKDRGAEGVVLSARPSEQRVVVEKVNVVKKALRPTPSNPQVVFQALRLLFTFPTCSLSAHPAKSHLV